MDGPTSAHGELTARFMFPPEFIGFQGHFPAKKVLPGVCQIQCALSMLEKFHNKHAILKEIVLAKYMAPVFPDDIVTCTLSEAAGTGNEFICKARITKESIKVTELKLRFCLGNAL